LSFFYSWTSQNAGGTDAQFQETIFSTSNRRALWNSIERFGRETPHPPSGVVAVHPSRIGTSREVSLGDYDEASQRYSVQYFVESGGYVVQLVYDGQSTGALQLRAAISALGSGSS
jgi:hypothetical protein